MGECPAPVRDRSDDAQEVLSVYKKKSLPTYPKYSYKFGYDDAICDDDLAFRPDGARSSIVNEENIPDTPLSVLLALMRDKWLDGDRDGAAEIARAAAPYMHHRLAPIAGQPETLLEAHLLTDAELKRHLELLGARKRAAREDPSLTP